MTQLDDLLRLLNDFSPIPAKNKDGKLEKLSKKIYKYLIIITILLFTLLLLLIGWHNFLSPLSRIFIIITQMVALIAVVLPAAYMLFDISVGVWSIINLKKRSYEWLILEINHDKEAIKKLIQFDEKLLEEAKQWLELKCIRMKNRISTLLGSSDKFALFSLMGLGWSVYKELSKIEPNSVQKTTANTANFLITGDITHDIFLMGVAFLTGLALGAMVVNYQVQRYIYLIELLQFSLKEKERKVD
ncbi:hypothetical protein F901_01797 [Acinetobacter dispersus]|uniref:hypothetical protein n=1 Tax=Acinetobacter dispersus TaxID=70348 RepID=UPI0002D026DB|nr:hypothetical protein [Acinetobacter dispersus]ENX54489.1 hypothetical protein F901_01797 [Acinetobacter dispersus]